MNLRDRKCISNFFLLLHLRWVLFKRFLIQVPFPYVLLLLAMALLLGYVLLKMDIPLSWQSVAGAATIQFFLCNQINYKQDKRLLLKQYRGLYPLSFFIDSFLLTIPFVLVNGYLWLTALIVASIYTVFDLSARRSVKFRPVLPSPFFMKSSYLWHARQRYMLPVIWILIFLVIVIAYFQDNYNLGIVVLGGGALVGFLAVILETEDAGFVRNYISTRYFVTRTLVETLYNTALYLFPLVVALFILFPAERWITLLFFPSVLLVNVQLLWTKYAFYPSSMLAAVIFFFGLLLQGALVITLYGIVVVPVYTVVLFFLFKNNIHAIISVYEKRL